MRPFPVRACTHDHGPSATPRFFCLALRQFVREDEEHCPPQRGVVVSHQSRFNGLKKNCVFVDGLHKPILHCEGCETDQGPDKRSYRPSRYWKQDVRFSDLSGLGVCSIKRLLGFPCVATIRSRIDASSYKMRDISRWKKKYIFTWALLGFLCPITVFLIGRFGDKLPGFVFAPIVPLIFVAVVLANAGLPAAIISALVLTLNVALYAGVGWLSWPLARLLSQRVR